jgi:isocitrate dehydrogenase (NAD+)
LDVCKRVAEDYPDIRVSERYVDIMAAELINDARRRDFKVFILPNLYGDIITDEAAEFQGGVGTAGSANIGGQYAMFEAIHGTGTRMIKEGRAKYANPSSLLRASAMLLSHIGYQNQAKMLERALDICTLEEKRLVMTGRGTGATCEQFGDYVKETILRLAD